VNHEARLREQCRGAVQAAKQCGAEEVEVFAQTSRTISVEIEKHDLQTSSSQQETMIGVRAFVGQRVGFACTNVLDELDATCADAVKLAKASPRDEHNILPEPVPVPAIGGLYDPAAESFSVADAVQHAIRMIETAEAMDRRLVLGGGSFAANLSTQCVVTTSGVDVAQNGSLFTFYALATAKDGAKVSNMAFHFDASHVVDGIDVVPVATHACRDALGSLGAEKGTSFVGPVVLSPNAVQSILVGLFSFQLNAKNALRGASRWGGSLGQSIAASTLTVVDDGCLPGGVATATFDREGMPHRKLVLIENGVPRALMHNAYTARAMKADNTAHASGSARSIPGIGPTNLSIAPGTTTKDELIGEIKNGLLVNRFSGSSNPISGDYSGVAKAAYLIKDGKLDRPVTGTLIAGNAFESLNKLTGISSDTERVFTAILPYIRIDDVSVTAE